ncbi:MAG TPA: CHASE domain-containing protein [Sphingomonadaceae bacterium]|nr:CHASE domain-containing protein [Sphingomonadaceae bacterium]
MIRFFSQKSAARRWLVQFPRAVPLAIFAGIMGVTLMACYAIERVEQRSQVAQLHERAGAIASALERRANANASYLRAGAALFSTLEDSPADHFRRFVSELRLDTDFRGADGIGWAQRVDPAEVADFDRLVMLEYGEDVHIRPAIGPGQPYAVPVTFLEPDTQRNRRALGYNMYAEPNLRAAMLEAERTARPSASGKVSLRRQGRDSGAGFLIYMPVFESVPGGARLRGFVYSAFVAQDFLASALLIASRGDLGIRLYDETASDDRLMASIAPGRPGTLSVREGVTIADHQWVLEVSSARNAVLSPLSVATLLFGLAAASLLALLARMLTQQAKEDGMRLMWFEEQNAIRDSLTRELNHRVKNTLANVLSIVALTRRRASDLDEFAEGLEGRIRALSATHDLLTQSEWGATPVGAVIEAELAPYARDCGPVIAMEGPHIELAPNDALSLGLAIHELATNAAKYGALSQPGGQLSIGWELEDGKARITWVEAGGPPVPAQRTRGFGMDLIEKIVAHELRHPVDLRFDPDGVKCILVVPVREVHAFELRRRF